MARLMPATTYQQPASGRVGYAGYQGVAPRAAAVPVSVPAVARSPLPAANSQFRPVRPAGQGLIPAARQVAVAPRLVGQAPITLAAQRPSLFNAAPTTLTAQRPSLITEVCQALPAQRVEQAAQPQLVQCPQQPRATSGDCQAAWTRSLAFERASASAKSSASAAAPRRASEPQGGIAADSELGHLLLLLRNPNLLAHSATKLFRRCDADGNGVLSLDELNALIPLLHEEIGLNLVEDSEDSKTLTRRRMRKYDINGDGVLSVQEFMDLYRWTLWLKYEDLEPPIQRRSSLIKSAHKGVPYTYYEIGAKLGQGQFGIVNSVKHRESGADRVLKTINKRTAVQSGTPLNMLAQEMDILALLDHPHVLRLFEHYNDFENIYIVTDVCYGGHLLDIVQVHCEAMVPMPEAWVSRVFMQALEAVGYCHSKGVMHKDIKFENLMLNKKVTCESPLEDIHVIVIDVGLSELFGPLHHKDLRSNIIAGSPATMAPEVIERNFSFKCDIWSFGCLLYAIFNNQPAFLPDGAGGQVLYTYPFAPLPTEEDPYGITGLLNAQCEGPSMAEIQQASPQAQEAVVRMLDCDERTRPNAEECLKLPWFSSYNPTHTVQLSEDQVKTLLRDRENSLWRRMVTLEAATQLPVSAVLELEREFEAMAASTGGTQIECSVLASALEAKGVPRDVCEKVAEVADLDRSGMIEWSEFLAAMLPASHELFAEALQHVFQEYDVNHDGFLDVPEVARMLREGHIDNMHMPEKKTVEMMIEDLDENHDGRVSFAEFHDYLLGETAK